MITATLPRPIFEKIIEATCKYYNITELELSSKERDTDTVYRRKIVITLTRQNTNMSYKKIASRLGLKDPAWLGNIVQEIESGASVYPQISHDIKNVMLIVGKL